MVDEAVRERIERFIAAAEELGISITKVILFGSRARGEADEWSDIDVMVISPVFDKPDARRSVDLLWQATASTNGHIEPVACGEKRWEEEDGSPIIEIARKEGIEVFSAA
jgi:predicted nucleotidyltransferase